MARTGRGWDAKPPAPKRRRSKTDSPAEEPLLWAPDEQPPPGDDAWSTEPGAKRPRQSLPWSNRDISANAPVEAGPPSSRRGTSEGERGSRHAGEAGLRWPPRDDALDESVAGSADSGGAGRRGKALPWSAKPAPAQDAPRSPEEIAREICLRQLAVRPRTRAELQTALSKRGVADEVARAVLDRYSEVGMIDDAAFARAWVNSRHHSKGLATRALAQELRRKGVDQEVATNALSELDSDTEAQTALDLALRKLRTTRGEPEQVFRRLVGMLARKGYPGGAAVRAVKEALATRDAELAELIDPDAYEE